LQRMVEAVKFLMPRFEMEGAADYICVCTTNTTTNKQQQQQHNNK